MSEPNVSISRAGVEVCHGRPIEPFRPYPIDVLPKTLRDFAIETSTAIGCDPIYVTLPMLSALGAAIGNSRRATPKADWIVPAIIWTVVIGESGTSKSPAQKAAVEPIHALQNQAFEAFKHATSKQHSKQSKPVKSSLPREKLVRFLVEDITVEALAAVLHDNPRGVLLSRDELAGWLTSMGEYKKQSSDLQRWLSIYSSTPITVDRKTGEPKTIGIVSPYVCIAGGVQPRIFRSTLNESHKDSGLLARILLAAPPRRQKQWSEKTVAPEVKEKYSSLIKSLFDLPASPQLLVTLAPAAQEIFAKWYNEHNREQVDQDGEIAAAWSKLEEIPIRIALIIHCCRVASNESKCGQIDEDTIKSAIRLTDWHKAETTRVYSQLSESKNAAIDRKYVEWIQRKGGETTARNFQSGMRCISNSNDAEKALNRLIEVGYGRWEPVGTTKRGGAPTKKFVLSTVYTT